MITHFLRKLRFFVSFTYIKLPVPSDTLFKLDKHISEIENGFPMLENGGYTDITMTVFVILYTNVDTAAPSYITSLPPPLPAVHPLPTSPGLCNRAPWRVFYAGTPE